MNPVDQMNVPILQSTGQEWWIFLWTSDISLFQFFLGLSNSLYSVVFDHLLYGNKGEF